MAATVRKLAPTEVELDIEVSESDFERARERAFQKLVKQIRLPGFRPGRVPRRIFEKHVGAEQIDHQAVEDVVPDVYAQALKDHNLEPVDRPHIDLERIADGKALRIKAKVAVRPEIALDNYRNIPIEKPRTEVSDEEVERSLQALRKRAATLEPVADRGLQAGDVVTMDYAGTVDGKSFDGSTATNHTAEISPEKFVPGFAEQLFGATAGERRTVTVRFPDAYHAANLAGREAVFEVAVHEVKAAVLPALDEDFPKQVSEFDTLDSLRTDLRRRLEAVANAQAREAMQGQLLDALLAKHEFPLPSVLVEREVENLTADSKSYMERIGRSWSEYLAAKGMDEAGLRAEYRAESERRVKAALLLEAIAKAEGIEVTAAELERELDHMARSYGRTRDGMVELVRRNHGFGPLIDSVRKEKTVGFLLEHADVRLRQPVKAAGQP